jgi:glutamyl-tRNA synthetase
MSQTKLSGPVRVRFAPSPTGFLHVGGARTAIYNDLVRQSLGGAFILRIEDTDRQRSDEAMTRQIQAALEWVGVTWDEGPYLQSERLGRHRERAEELLAKGLAYRCFCTPEELDAARKAVEATGERFRYPGTCLQLTPEQSAERAAAGQPSVVRFRMPPGNVRFHDLVRGEVEFPPDALDDFVLLRSDGSPTYHLSVCVDDVDMEVTHVVRGEDHLSNTPKHVALFAALGAPPPVFGHLPLILGPDRKRLSKRVGSTSVEEFRAEGILPEALYNYLALLGWSPGDDRELMIRDEMIELFTVERLNASAAVFDRDKLAWMNGQYIAGLPLAELVDHLEPFLERAGIGGAAAADRERLGRAVELHRVRARTLVEMAEQLVPYFVAEPAYDPEAVAKHRGQPELPGQLARLRDLYAAVEPFEVEPLEAGLRALADELGVKAAHLIHPLRMALTGTKAGPPVFDLVAFMGREQTRRRLDRFLEHLGEAAATEQEAPVGAGGTAGGEPGQEVDDARAPR